jgi:hypothetical protein
MDDCNQRLQAASLLRMRKKQFRIRGFQDKIEKSKHGLWRNVVGDFQTMDLFSVQALLDI